MYYIIHIHIPFTYGAQLYPTLCNSLYCSLPGSSVHGIFQARILKWVAISSSRGSSQPRNQTRISCITGGFFTSWATREAKLSLKYASHESFPGQNLGMILTLFLILYPVPIPSATLSTFKIHSESTAHQLPSCFPSWKYYNFFKKKIQ